MKFLFFCVDCQKDFINKDGKLSVAGAEEIKPALSRLTNIARERRFKVISSVDWHNENSVELSNTPDFINTFPEHCMKDTHGADFITEVDPSGALVIPYNIGHVCKENISFRNVIIEKDKFDVFEGNPYTDEVIQKMAPDVKNTAVFCYGVAMNVCVDYAVVGLRKRGYKVYVVLDAVKELPNLGVDKVLDKWIDMGVRFASVNIITPDYASELFTKVILQTGQNPVLVENLLDADGDIQFALPDGK